ncbi:hypothetical protein SSX86_017312 [Deinandra increscens subsp. villosa]|uniref:Transcription factor MYC/MYB N-terminal domain-containing protein n=1 Tax=Deinandra increscens subsp. villosa TaxID=3103831 RepID=A0AAP0CZV2_9ASTR
MEEMQVNQVAVTHLLQHTLRSFCIHENSQWVYAVFWRILPRNYPPPKWDGLGGAYDRSRGNRRNWILVWEDGFCNFGASSSSSAEISTGDCSVYADHEYQQCHGLQPELFFKMSHEIYNYGEGLIGKVAADHSHKWIYKEPNDHHEINFLSSWNNSADSHPRTWEAQFQSGVKTIALIAVREGVIQLGSIHKVIEDLNYVVLLRKKFSYIENIPGVLLPHPSSSAYPLKAEQYNTSEAWHHFHGTNLTMLPPPDQFYNRYNYSYNQPLNITPSMSSLEALLSKLPSVVPVSSSPPPVPPFCEAAPPQYMAAGGRPAEFWAVEAKEEVEEEDVQDGGECSSSMTFYNNDHFGYHYDS